MPQSSKLVLTLVAAALFMTACSGSSTNTNTANKPQATPTPAAATNANAAATPSATTNNPSTSPTAVFKAFYEASKNADEEAFKKTLSKDTLAMFEEATRERKKTLAQVLKESDVPATLPETRNEKIDGDKATIEVKDDKADKWETFKFVKEDGQWKVVIDK
jgi:hypothetical protein